MKYFFLFLFCGTLFASQVQLGVDNFFQDGHYRALKGKNVALITNQTGVDGRQRPTLELLEEAAKEFKIVALFSPEHGWAGEAYAGENVGNKKEGKLPCFSLHGDHRRPTAEMLKGIDVIVYPH